MDTKNLLLFIISIISVIFSYAFTRGKRKKASKIYGLFVLSVALWSFGLGFFRMTSNLNTALIFAKIYYIAAAAIPSLFLYFSFSFPEEKNVSKIKKFLIFLPFILFVLVFIFKDGFLIKDINYAEWGKNVHLNFFDYFIYNLYFLFYVIFSYYNLFKSYYLSTGIIRKQLNFIFAGTIVPYIIAMSTNLFMPWINYKYIWVGPMVVLAMVVSISYAITKHHLLNIKVIATELFSALLFIILLIRFLLSDSTNQFLLNGAIVLGFAIFGILLIRSVWKEVQQKEEIQKLANRLSDFVSFVTHELRTPVTKFKGALSNILSKTYGDIGNRNLEDMLLKLRVVAQEMGQSIETFLAMNKIEIKKLELILKPVDLNELFGMEINELQPLAKQKNIWLKFNSKTGLPAVMADEFQLKHVLDNIISNAVKYTPENGHIAVYFEIPAKGGEVITVVEDNGIGIEKDTMPTLFSKYERGESSSKKFAEGTGLGLFLAKQIIEMHNGKIWAESEGKGKGSKFKFSLPVYEKNTSAEDKN